MPSLSRFSYTEEEVDPQLLINGWESTLQEQVKSDRHPKMTPGAAAHELHGFKPKPFLQLLYKDGLGYTLQAICNEVYLLSLMENFQKYTTVVGWAKEKGPSDKQTTPDEEGLHPNLVEMYAKAHRRARRTLHDQATDGSAVTPPPPLETDAQQ